MTPSPRLSESEQVAWVITLTKWLISFTASAWLAADTDIKVLAILSVADVLIGIFNPAVSLLMTCRRLAVTFILVGTVHFVYGLARAQTGLNLGFDISAVVSVFYCLGEGISILKNCDAIGIQLPPQLLSVISKAEGLTGSDRREIIALQLKHNQEGIALDLKMAQQKDDDGKIIKP